ncbi:MAG TPA: hypothetical protein VLC09_04645 [Polyangiaceae bacterium]|nr:hypothetical protein [Polyangiaceae bacterium]
MRRSVSGALPRRHFVGALSLLGLGLITGEAHAGSYLTRAAVLLRAAEQEAEVLRRRLADKELAQVLHRVASARVDAARAMSVPKDVASAHPHVLLVLEAYERAADAAERGDGQAFLVAVARAREETSTLRAVLKQLGWELPELKD